MKRLLVILIAVLVSILVSGLTVRAQDGCTISQTQKNGVTIIDVTGCKEVVFQIAGTQVYPIPPVVEIPATPVPTADTIHVFKQDNGSDNAFTDSVSAKVLFDLEVHDTKDINGRETLVIARKGKYYPVICGDDSWLKISYDGTPAWVVNVGSKTGRHYVELVLGEKDLSPCID